MSEFELIQQFFTERQSAVSYVPLGIGDDCALMRVRDGMQLAISTDMLVEGRHFFSGADARMLGHKALAVNLSDLAAMGAEPRAFTLALALPDADQDWLRNFSQGLFELAVLHSCQLIGGDTTRGPLNISITVLGEIPEGLALRRDGAQIGDDIWVSGSLGEARLALAGCLREQILPEAELALASLRLHQPTPRVALGLGLRTIAHAAIDISDGLAGDLGHILKRSHLGATLWCNDLPVGEVLRTRDRSLQIEFALAGGDDYELCFTAPRHRRSDVLALAHILATPVTRIGFTEVKTGLRIVDQHNKSITFLSSSFDHFQS